MVSFLEIDDIVLRDLLHRFLRLMTSFLAFDCIGPVLGFALVELMGTLKVGPMQSNDKNDVVINSKSDRTSTVCYDRRRDYCTWILKPVRTSP